MGWKHPLNIILLIGSPGSGKSSFANSYLSKYDYIRLNNDEIRDQKNIRLAYIDSINNNKRIVIDNTNYDKKTREYYINTAKYHNYKVFSIYFKTDRKISMYLNTFRENISSYNNYRKSSELKLFSEKAPDIAIHSFFKKLEESQKDEGFEETLALSFYVDFPEIEDKNEKEAIDNIFYSFIK